MTGTVMPPQGPGAPRRDQQTNPARWANPPQPSAPQRANAPMMPPAPRTGASVPAGQAPQPVSQPSTMRMPQRQAAAPATSPQMPAPLQQRPASDQTRTFFGGVHFGPETVVVIEDGDASVYPLAGHEVWALGRAMSQEPGVPTLRVRSSIVSSHHGRFVLDSGRWFYQSQHTTNPTYINGMQLQPDTRYALNDGDLIRIDGALDNPDAQGVIIVFTVDQNLGLWKSYRLPRQEGRTTYIGRADAPDTIVQNVPYVSRRHARIDYIRGHYVIRDIRSRIGTYIDGQPLRGAHTLREKDVIAIGDCRFYFTKGTIVYDKRVGAGAIAAAKPTPAPSIAVPAAAPAHAVPLAPRVTTTLGKAGAAPVAGISVPVQAAAAQPIMLDVQIDDKTVGGRHPKTLLKDIHFQIPQHSLVAIIGTSGAGKTLLLNCLSGKDTLYNGHTLYKNQEDLRAHYKNLGPMIGYVQQSNVFLQELTVFEEIYSSAKLRMAEDSSRAEIKEQVDSVLHKLDIYALKDSPIKKLSGGQKRRVSVARELVGYKPVLCLDEPDAGLSYIDKDKLFTKLRDIVHPPFPQEGRAGGDGSERVLSIIMVIHEIDMLEMFDEVIVVASPKAKDPGMRNPGRLAFAGSPHDALAHFGDAKSFREMFKNLNGQISDPDHITFEPYEVPGLAPQRAVGK